MFFWTLYVLKIEIYVLQIQKKEYIDIYYMLQRNILYVAKTKCICCKDKMYMLQRQNLYAAKTKCICYKDKFICYKDKRYML